MKTKTFCLNVDGKEIANELYGSTDDSEKILLFCHGFPGTNRLNKLAPILEDRNISTVEINYRGDKKSEGNFSFLGSIKDIKQVTDYLKNEYDNSKIYALGYSMGGFYICNIIKEDPKLFDKTILLNPVVDTQTLFSNAHLMKELWNYARDILSLEKPEVYDEEIKLVNKKYNPMDFVDKIKTPIYFVQSTDDEVLPFETAKRFYSLLNCEKRFIEIPGATHDLDGDEKQLVNLICD